MLLEIESLYRDSAVTFPNGVEIKSDNVSGNILIFDFKKIVFIDSTNGKASLILTADPFGLSYIKFFDEKWKKALRINPGMLANKIPKEALTLSKMVENELSQILLELSIKHDDNYTCLINEIEKYGNEINCKSIEEIVSIIDYALRISYSGYVTYESQNDMLQLHFDSKEKSAVPWALIIIAYIKKIGKDAKIIYDQREMKENTIYIKLLYPSVIHVN
jgi:hypothetical protein